jgi:hypothetical protein
MDRKQIEKAVERHRLEESLRADFEVTVTMRVDRYLQVKPHEIVPNTYFAVPLAQCSELYRDGHYYGCIALAQAVAEALVRHIYQKKISRAAKSFEGRVEALSRKGYINQELNDNLLKIWEDRNDYHHLNPCVETDIARLEEIALEKVSLLVKVMSIVFAFSNVGGKLAPKYPEYWEMKGQLIPVFLNLE